MLSKPKHSVQTSFFLSLAEQLNPQHPLYLLSNAIDWSVFETAFSKHYSATMGKPAKPIRLMVSLLILKQLRNLSDENLVAAWSENLYYQYFGGEQYFVPDEPCVPAGFSHNPILKINELAAKSRCRYNPGFKCSQTPINKYYGNIVCG